MNWLHPIHNAWRSLRRLGSPANECSLAPPSLSLLCESLESRELLTTFVVDTRDDAVQVDGLISLREAILAANANAPVADAPAGSPGLDAITFASLSAGWKVQLASGPFHIAEDLDILGLEAEPLVLDSDSDSSHLIIENSSVRLRNAHFINGVRTVGGSVNSGGGSIHASNSNLELVDVEFRNCSTDARGGALYISGGTLQITRGRFEHCTAQHGGAIYVIIADGANPSIAESVFVENQAHDKGGAILLSYANSDTTISDCQFIANQAGLGGAVYAVDRLGNEAMFRVVRSEFRENLARRRGGAIDAENARLVVHSCQFAQNVARDPDEANRGDGGAIYLQGGERSQLSASSFLANEAERNGGAVFIAQDKQVGSHQTVFEGNRALGQSVANGGGAVFNHNGTVRLSSVRFVGNHASGFNGAGGAILSMGGLLTSIVTCDFQLNWASRSGGALELVDGDLRLAARFGNADLADRGNFVRPAPPQTSSFRAGGAISVSSNQRASNVLFAACDFYDNAADFGGAIFVGAGSFVEFRWGSSTLVRNAAAQLGGALYAAGHLDFSTPTSIEFNVAGVNGGGLLLTASATLENLANVAFLSNSPNDLYMI